MSDQTRIEAERVHVRKCLDMQCRVETFKGTSLIPLSGCPVCLQPGTMEPARPTSGVTGRASADSPPVRGTR